jgi:hypothetical protein
MISVAKSQGITTTSIGGKQTIVIAAPKGGTGTGSVTPAKIITTMPKLGTSTSGGTQYIVVNTQGSGTPGGVTVKTVTAGGKFRCTNLKIQIFQ